MVILAKLIGVLVTVLGLAIFASPQFTQKIFDFFKKGKRIYYAGVIRTVIGLVLFICASQSSVPLAAIALGLMFLVSGIAVFAADTEKIKAFMAAYGEMPGLVLRLLGPVAASFGILIFSIF
jgi:uncharacterized protein YjeT (DUF2065 family)